MRIDPFTAPFALAFILALVSHAANADEVCATSDARCAAVHLVAPGAAVLERNVPAVGWTSVCAPPCDASLPIGEYRIGSLDASIGGRRSAWRGPIYAPSHAFALTQGSYLVTARMVLNPARVYPALLGLELLLEAIGAAISASPSEPPWVSNEAGPSLLAVNSGALVTTALLWLCASSSVDVARVGSAAATTPVFGGFAF